MERTFKHEVTYTNRGRVPVADVAASLVANERLMREAIEALQDIFPGLEVTDVSVVFRRATSDSPLQEAMEAVGNIVFQNDMEARIPEAIRLLTGVDFPDRYDTMITVIVIAIVTYGVYWALSKVGKKDDSAGLTVNGNYNQVIYAGRDLLGVDEDRLREAVERRFAKNRGPTVSRRALEMIRPAQLEAGAAVQGAGLEISAATVSAAPSALDAEMADDEQTQDPYTDQEIVVHATDLDSNKTGWAGHLPGIWEKRLPMRLYPTIKPEDIYGKRTVTGDVIVVSKRGRDGEYVPYLFHVVGLD